jgi:hypothetical protein
MAARVQRQSNVPDYRVYQVAPPRKPVASHHAGLQFQPAQQQQQAAPSNNNHLDHAQHQNRTTSSYASAQKHNNSSTSHNNHHSNNHHHNHHFAHRPAPHTQALPPPSSAGPSVPTRTLSNATSSSNSTGNNHLTQTMSSASSDIHRSSSGRSAPVQLSYVALMRRQKGTVWCDRAQPEDPRLQAQKRAARQRAHMELHGGARSGPLASGKIRHHSGKAGPTSFSPSTLVGATVPVRLSANEVGDDYADDHSSEGGMFHRRASGSARSSLGSMQRYPSGYQRQPGKTPPNEQADIPEVVETAPVEGTHSYNSSRNSSLQKDTELEGHDEHHENDFGDIGEMAAPAAAKTAMQKAKKADDLRRRGSVDERTTSLTGGRLFVANPDRDD